MPDPDVRGDWACCSTSSGIYRRVGVGARRRLAPGDGRIVALKGTPDGSAVILRGRTDRFSHTGMRYECSDGRTLDFRDTDGLTEPDPCAR